MLKFSIVLSFIVFSCGVHSFKVKQLSSQKWIQPYSPYWDRSTGTLIMVDLMNGTIISYTESTNKIVTSVLPFKKPSFVVKLRTPANQYMIGDHLSGPIIKWNRVSNPIKIRDSFSILPGSFYQKQNWDVAQASPTGTFIGGTFRGTICSTTSGEPAAKLYIFDKENGVREVYVPNLKSSGGIAFNAKGDKVYHVSACEKVIREFTYNKQTGLLSNRRIVFKYTGGYGDPVQTVPLGLTIDTNNYLYVTLYYGGAVLKVNPVNGKIITAIKIPAEVVTAVQWGGKNMDKLFVTTANKAFDVITGSISSRKFKKDSGKVFVVTGLGAKGVPQNALDI